MTTTITTKRRTAPLDLLLVLTLVAVAAGLWALWHHLGVALTVDTGSGRHAVGLTAVLVTTVLAGVAAVVSRWAMRGLGLGVWLVLALCVWAASFVGPLGATTIGAGLALASFHLAVGGGAIAGLGSVHRARR